MTKLPKTIIWQIFQEYFNDFQQVGVVFVRYYHCNVVSLISKEIGQFLRLRLIYPSVFFESDNELSQLVDLMNRGVRFKKISIHYFEMSQDGNFRFEEFRRMINYSPDNTVERLIPKTLSKQNKDDIKAFILSIELLYQRNILYGFTRDLEGFIRLFDENVLSKDLLGIDKGVTAILSKQGLDNHEWRRFLDYFSHIKRFEMFVDDIREDIFELERFGRLESILLQFNVNSILGQVGIDVLKRLCKSLSRVKKIELLDVEFGSGDIFVDEMIFHPNLESLVVSCSQSLSLDGLVDLLNNNKRLKDLEIRSMGRDFTTRGNNDLLIENNKLELLNLSSAADVMRLWRGQSSIKSFKTTWPSMVDDILRNHGSIESLKLYENHLTESLERLLPVSKIQSIDIVISPHPAADSVGYLTNSLAHCHSLTHASVNSSMSDMKSILSSLSKERITKLVLCVHNALPLSDDEDSQLTELLCQFKGLTSLSLFLPLGQIARRLVDNLHSFTELESLILEFDDYDRSSKEIPKDRRVEILDQLRHTLSLPTNRLIPDSLHISSIERLHIWDILLK